MKVRYWTNYSKRKNSTKQPALDTGVEVDVNLLNDCSIIDPIIQTDGIPQTANYFYIPDFDRYYFLNGPTKISNSLTEFKLEVDPLASYKSNIGSTAAHITYSSTGYDKDIIDTRIAQHTTKQWATNSIDFTSFSATGCFVLSVLSKDGGATGFQSAYLLTVADLQALCNVIMSLDVNSWIIGAVYAPLDCMVSCKWFPLDYSVISSTCCTTGDRYLGALSIGTGPIVTNPVYFNSITFGLTPRYNDFRRLSASNYYMFMPFAGLFDISQNSIIKSNGALSVRFSLDLITGSMVITEADANLNILNMTEVGYGVDCPLASVQGGNINNFVSNIATAAAGVGAGAASGNIAGMVGAAAAGIAGATQEAATKQYRTKGTQGSRAYYYEGLKFKLIEETWDTENPNSADYIAKQGRPVFQTHAISNHSGYVQCEGASVDMAGSAIEKQRVNDYLNTGFYYE